MLFLRRFIFIALFIALLSPNVLAQRVLVLTSSYNAAREPVGVHAQVADIPTASVLPGTLSLPGSQFTQALNAISSAEVLYISTGIRDSPGESYMMELRTSPLEQVAITHFPKEENWSHKVLGTVHDEAGRLHTVALATELESASSKISFYDWNAEHTIKEISRWGISREISDAMVLDDSLRVVALYRGGNERPGGIISGEMGAAPTLRNVLPEPIKGAGHFQPLKLAQFGNSLLLLGQTAQIDLPDKNVLWAQWLTADTLVPRAPAVQLSGSQMGSAEPLLYDGANGFWISSRSSDTRFAFVTHLTLQENRLEKTAAYSLPKTSTPVYLSQSPDGLTLAVTYNETLEIWPNAQRESMLRKQFSEPLGALAWLNKTQLLLGEAGHLHLVNSSDTTVTYTVPLKSGWIEKIIPLPAHLQNSKYPENDNDKDGIVDALDPEPLNPSPKLNLPYKITFRGNAIGHEVRALQFSPEHFEEASWSVEVMDPESADWLRMAPQKGIGRSAVYMGVDPERYARGSWAETWLKVHLDGVTMREAYGSPKWLLVQVQSQKENLRRILWVWDKEHTADLRDESDPRTVRTLVNMLAAPPLHFSHHEIEGVVDLKLQKYTILVVPLRALAQGQLVRSELLDYVLGGGAVLILGDLPIDPLPRTLHEWFRPAGVDMLLASPVSGTFPVLPQEGIDGHGTNLFINQGARFVSETGALAPLGKENTESALVAKDYGYGRMLFLSDSSALQSDTMSNEQQLQFVISCFTWLAAAGMAFSDMDGDLLVDGIEDFNDNGVVDPGETDFLNADSDRDYLPDGAEDLNRNGKVDAGETDPRNTDTDNDTNWDAADATPIPETKVQLPIL